LITGDLERFTCNLYIFQWQLHNAGERDRLC
jgi:hypothetical protein